MVYALQTLGLSSLVLWDTIMGRENVLQVHEDNQAMIQVAKTGRNPTMRYLPRTHRVSVRWVHEACTSDSVRLAYAKTTDMAADVYTNTHVQRWDAAC